MTLDLFSSGFLGGLQKQEYEKKKKLNFIKNKKNMCIKGHYWKKWKTFYQMGENSCKSYVYNGQISKNI